LPGLGRSTSASKKAVLSWLNIPDAGNGSDMIISPVGPSSDLDNDPLHQYIQSRLQASEKLELDRLLYVACTRARVSLHLLGHVNTSHDGSEMKKPHSGSLLHRLWPALESEYAKAFDACAFEPEAPDVADKEIFAFPILKRAATDWTMPAPPILPKKDSGVLPPIDVNEKPVEFYWVGTAARHAGTIVHRWLRKFSEEHNWPAAEQLSDTDETTRRWASDLRVTGDAMVFVCDRVRSALSGLIKDPQGCWILEGEGHAEFALTGLWQGRAESIVIDRVRIDDQGNHWIIDYKTSTHEGGDLDGFLQQEADRYRTQLQKYSTIYQNFVGVPVKTALYFPLLQRFREVSMGGN
jgi:ATP-dependent helicase/nuclease subunit A